MATEETYPRVLDPEAARASLSRYYERMVEPRPITARTRPEWLARRPVLRQEVRACLGLEPAPSRLPLDVRVTGRLVREGYSLERLFFQSWPGQFAGGWLYVPAAIENRAPAILSPHGHFTEGAMAPVVQSRCIALARKGYVVLAVDSVHLYRYDIGVNAVGVMTWNNMRALDYLTARDDVDRERIGCVGESGGGQQTMYLMALDDRVKVAVPVAIVSYFKRILAPGPLHCPCNHVPGLMRVADQPEICALFAPRPLLYLSLTGDWTAPFPTAEYGEIQNVYHLWGQVDRLDHEQFDGPHDFTLPMRERAYAWFNRWLKGIDDPEAAREGEVTPEPIETLQALNGPMVRDGAQGLFLESRGQEGEGARLSPGDWTAREAMFVAPRLEGRDSRKSYQSRLRAELTELLGGEIETAVAEPAIHAEGETDGLLWQAVSFRSEREIRVPGRLWRAPDAPATSPAVLLLPLTPSPLHPFTPSFANAGYRVLTIDPRLRGELAADWFHNTVLWGRPEVGMAVTDAQAAVGYLWQRGDVERRAVAVVGAGEMGVAALLTGALDERVAVTVADCRETTYQDGGEGLPVIPNLLRHADLPQIASLIAPRPLILCGVPSQRAGFASRRYFDWTQRSFQSLGAADALNVRTGPFPATDDVLRWVGEAVKLRGKQKG